MPIGNGSGCFLVACSAQKHFLAGGIEKVMSHLFLRIIIGTDAFQDYGLFMNGENPVTNHFRLLIFLPDTRRAKLISRLQTSDIPT